MRASLGGITLISVKKCQRLLIDLLSKEKKGNNLNENLFNK
jgi:hypothetical protein